MVTPAPIVSNTFYCPTNVHNVKKRGVIKTLLKLRRLLEHVGAASLILINLRF
jgi:hypothetical protein